MGSDRHWRIDPGHDPRSANADAPLPAKAGPDVRRRVSSLHIGTGGMPRQNRAFDQHTYGITSAMAALGHPTGLLIAAEVPGSDLPRQVDVRRFAACEVPLVRRWLDVKETFQQAAEAQRPDIIVSHFALYAVALLDDLKRLPHVAHYYGRCEGGPGIGGEMGWTRFHEKRQERAVYNSADLVIAYSAASREGLIHEFEVDATRVRLVEYEMDPTASSTSKAEREHSSWQGVASQVLDIYQEAIGQG